MDRTPARRAREQRSSEVAEARNVRRPGRVRRPEARKGPEVRRSGGPGGEEAEVTQSPDGISAPWTAAPTTTMRSGGMTTRGGLLKKAATASCTEGM